MPNRTTEEIEKRKTADIKMNRLNCGWNLAPKDLADIITFLNGWTPKTEVEKRDKHILELAFINDMNASQISRLNDPLIIGMGNRNHGKQLSAAWIWKICIQYAPQAIKRGEHGKTKKPPRKNAETRNELHRQQLRGEIDRPKICAACGSTDNIELHHIIPIAAGGTNEYFNLINLCHACHMKLHRSIYDRLKWPQEQISF